jgi:hypothetical protein
LAPLITSDKVACPCHLTEKDISNLQIQSQRRCKKRPESTLLESITRAIQGSQTEKEGAPGLIGRALRRGGRRRG